MLEADYLVIGAGAVSLAFVDTLITEQSDTSFIIVDKHAAPGGHWNDAYPFVRLHQPSAFYGVNSLELSAGRVDTAGSNKGYHELASGPEVLAYFDRLMMSRLLPSGRVQYFPFSEVTEEGKIRSLITGEETSVKATLKTVNGTYYKTIVPSTHKRKYTSDDGVAVIPPNDLPKRATEHRHFTVVGAGKTAMDALVWLLEHGARQQQITWVAPRESWLINRVTTQPGQDFFEGTVGGVADEFEVLSEATSIDDAFLKLEERGNMLRINPDITPTMMHYATISTGEIDLLRTIEDVIRGARVTHIGDTALKMADGRTIPARPNTLYIDCTATPIENAAEVTPVFTEDTITLQPVRRPLVTFSAALVGWVEAHGKDTAHKNSLTMPVKIGDGTREYLESFLGNLMNQFQWNQNKELITWITESRLDLVGKMIRDADLTDPAKGGLVKRLSNAVPKAISNIQKILAEAS